VDKAEGTKGEERGEDIHNKTVIILLGSTAVGKTGVSILLAKALKTEIISADSMQIYRHMDIGTAKPSRSELHEIKHHLIDILSPDRPFSAGLFKEMAVKIIDLLHSLVKVPLIVGGTGLYIRTLTQGLFEGPDADWSLRQELEQEEEAEGKGHLYERLKKIDPEAAEKIEPNDLRRTIRALEVCLKDSSISEKRKISTEPEPYRFIKIGLTRNRDELYRIIDDRVDGMMKEGLLQETEALLKMNPHRTPLQALGYKEMVRYLDKEIGLDEAVKLLKQRTRNYAKRQMTWFRKEPNIRWVDLSGIKDRENMFEKVLNEVETIKELI
jgi:tRNA dimethylallyltransferase